MKPTISNKMIDIMYASPSEKNSKTCTITKEVVENHATPKLTYYKKTA